VVILVDGLHFEEDENNMFGVGASMENSSRALVTRKLFLFWRLVISPPMCANPLVWWKTHEGQFPNVDFFAKQVFKFSSFKLRLKISS
jgi:hypothetical protein